MGENFKFESMVELFEMLDGDASGMITEEEFVNGLLNLSLTKLHQVPPESFITLKLSRSLTRRASQTFTQLIEVRNDLQQLRAELAGSLAVQSHSHWKQALSNVFS